MERSRYSDATSAAPRGMPSQSFPSALRNSAGADRGATPNAWGSQEVRSNLALQPVTDTSAIKLKKKAVKMVGPAGPLPATQPATSSLPVMLRPIGPGAGTANVSTVSSPIANPGSAPSQKKKLKSCESPESMDAMFARLNNKGSESCVRDPGDIPISRPNKDIFSFEDANSVVPNEEPIRNNTAKSDTTAVADTPIEYGDAAKSNNSEATEHEKRLPGEPKRGTKLLMEAKAKDAKGENRSMMQTEIEHQYMVGASTYIDALPAAVTSTAHLIKMVSKKLSGTYAPDKQTNCGDKGIIKARFALAIAKYINKALREGQKARTADSIKQTLEELDGDFLQLCAKLVEEDYISMETLDDVTGLVKTMVDAFSEAESIAVASTIDVPKPQSQFKPAVEGNESNHKDAIDSKKDWPLQEKREKPTAHRTCILKGVANVTSINRLQALVWGGRLESISMPVSGSSSALVKFLTAEACAKYHQATANGIEVVAGDTNKAVVLVELAEGPNSSNDVIQKCIEGGITRCVRVIGHHDYTDTMLLQLARGGKSQANNKREVDRIKRGTTARNHTYVEFRFANIYHALDFKSDVLGNEDWEPCTITHTPDPCELAVGVHYTDEDEDENEDDKDTRAGFLT